jgi:hypothetical protein
MILKKTLLLLTTFVFALQAGPNSEAKILVDLNVSTPQIDSVKTAASGTLMVGIYCRGAVNLDTYTFDIAFNPAVVSFQTAVEDNPLAGLTNILKKNGGQTIPVKLGLKKGCTDTIEINNTLEGSDSAKAPEGDGLLCILLFNVVKIAPCTLSLHNATFLDYEGLKDTTMGLTNGRIVQSTALRSANSSAQRNSTHNGPAISPMIGGNRSVASGTALFDIRGRLGARRGSGNCSTELPAGMYIVKK